LDDGEIRGLSTPMPRELVPEFAVTTSKRKELPDFIVVHGMMCISERLRDHITSLEPGRNQYLPFTPLGPKRTPWLGPDEQPIRYYLVHITERIDAVDLARSAPSRIVQPPRYFVQPQYEKVVMRKGVIADHHVWSGQFHMSKNVFISDTLGDWIVANKMKGMEMYQIEESDS
jgi:hypothetical protein